MTSAPETLSHHVGGAAFAGTGGRYGDVFDPATGAVAAKVPLASREDVAHAVTLAAAAFPAWAAVTPLNRARVLFKFKALLERDADAIAQAISREHGKVFSDAKGELTRGLEVVEFACGIPHLLNGLNIHAGKVTYEAVAQDLGYTYVPAAKALA